MSGMSIDHTERVIWRALSDSMSISRRVILVRRAMRVHSKRVYCARGRIARNTNHPGTRKSPKSTRTNQRV
jgi:hypothetical protein